MHQDLNGACSLCPYLCPCRQGRAGSGPGRGAVRCAGGGGRRAVTKGGGSGTYARPQQLACASETFRRRHGVPRRQERVRLLPVGSSEPAAPLPPGTPAHAVACIRSPSHRQPREPHATHAHIHTRATHRCTSSTASATWRMTFCTAPAARRAAAARPTPSCWSGACGCRGAGRSPYRVRGGGGGAGRSPYRVCGGGGGAGGDTGRRAVLTGVNVG